MRRKKSPLLSGAFVPEPGHLLFSLIGTADEQGSRCWAPGLLLGDDAGPGPLPRFFLFSTSFKGDQTGAPAAAAACSIR